jgi:hypothetical protein
VREVALALKSAENRELRFAAARAGPESLMAHYDGKVYWLLRRRLYAHVKTERDLGFRLTVPIEEVMQEQLNSLEKSMEIIGANAFHTTKSFKLPDKTAVRIVCVRV